jgi:preprotein translocase subunit SecF
MGEVRSIDQRTGGGRPSGSVLVGGAGAKGSTWPRQRWSIDFMAFRRHAVAFSVATTLASLISLVLQSLNLGLDFTGGTLLEIGYGHPVDVSQVRAAVADSGYADAQVQYVGGTSGVLIRLPPSGSFETTDDLAGTIKNELTARDASAVVRRAETVGPQVGDELAEQGGLAMLFALLGIFVYVMLRFRWKFALGAIVATMHDVIVTVGIFSLLRWEFDLTVLGAVLAVIGYSVNDTIVVYDRIRDNFRLMRKGSAEAIVNASVNQTMSRTIITGLTTLLVVFALLALGGETLRGFSLALIVGIVVGTYSSIYVASGMALALKVQSEDFVARAAEQADDLP